MVVKAGGRQLLARACWSLAGVASTSYSFYLLEHMGHLSRVVDKEFGWHFQFLTIIGLSLTWLTMLLSFVSTLIEDGLVSTAKERLSVICVGLEGLISTGYWSILAYDPKMLIPANQTRIPLHIDLSLHVLPALFLWIDFLVFSSAFDRERSRPLLTSCIFAATYTPWMEYCAHKNGHFPYPFLNDLVPPIRVLIYAGSTFVVLGLFYLANAIHHLLDAQLSRERRKKE